jgi:uncharacterized membrane protein YeaQ/YmgE (transglycosylase-associated protein family)
MSIIGLIAVGLVIGVLARLLMPGRDPIGILGTIAVGIVGAVAGGYLTRAIGWNTEGYEVIGGILFAMVLLYLYRRVAMGRGTA